MLWIRSDVSNRDLVRAPESLQVVVVDLPRRRPSLGAAQNDHRQSRADRFPGVTRFVLDFADLEDAVRNGRSNRLLPALRVAAFDEIRRVPLSSDQRLQFLVANARQNRGVVDLVA